MYMVLQMRVQGNHFPGRVWDSVPKRKKTPGIFPGVIFIWFERLYSSYAQSYFFTVDVPFFRQFAASACYY